MAQRPPIVVLTSNRSRDLRRIAAAMPHHWIDYPDPLAAEIVRRTVPGATNASSSTPLNSSVGQGSSISISRQGVAETIDWVAALVAVGVTDLVSADTERALAGNGALAKTPDDYAAISDAPHSTARTREEWPNEDCE